MLVCALQEGLQPGVVVGEYIGETNNTNTAYDEAPPLKLSNVALSNVGSPSCSQDRRKLLNEPGYVSLFDGEAWRLHALVSRVCNTCHVAHVQDETNMEPSGR